MGYLSEVRVGLAMTAAAFVIYYADISFLKSISLLIYDSNFHARDWVEKNSGGPESEKDVVIAAIDEKSIERFGRWPWSRSVIADLIDRLNGFGPKAIGLDIVFDSPERRADMALARELLEKIKKTGRDGQLQNDLKRAAENADVDAKLARAIKNAGNVVAGYFFFTEAQEIKNIKLDNRADYKIIRKSQWNYELPPKNERDFDFRKTDFKFRQALGARPNIKAITDAAAYTGYFNLIPDIDGVYRKMTNVIEFQIGNSKRYFPHMAMQSYRLAAKKPGVKGKFSFKLRKNGVDGFTVGDTFIPSDGRGQSLLNYYGPERTFRYVSISDLLEGGEAGDRYRQLIKDKVVLAGATAKGIYDVRNTPYGIMPGAEVQATFIQNVMDGNVLKWQKEGQGSFYFIFNELSILGLGLLLTAAMRRLNLFYGGLLALGLMVSYYVFQLYMFIGQHVWLDILYPMIALFIVYGGIAFYKYAVESGERRFIKKAFGHYISPEVVNQIIADPSKLELGGQEKVMTAFFTDIKGFSSFSEKMGPHDLVELLNEYLSEMTEIIRYNHGTLDKYIGDAIVAFFGAPLDDERHAVKACRAALESQRRLAALREKWKARDLPPIEVRIGINTGRMLVGNMGSKDTFNYTMMGDEVNLASRLEGLNKQYGSSICITESTLNAANGEFEARELDLVRVVGRETPVRIYELMALKGGLTPEREKQRAQFHQALKIYRARKWEEASALFAELHRLYDDTAAVYYVRRCRRFMELPPGSDWDGVFSITKK
ncbi:MAG: CHASE2 domain-containing protein [Nitrospinota bacterium]